MHTRLLYAFIFSMLSMASITYAENKSESQPHSEAAKSSHQESTAPSKSEATKSESLKNEAVKSEAVKSEATKAESGEKRSSASSKAETEKKVLGNLPSDVRVLIDISGSMKKTDPQNLRKPAVNLISRLLPDKSRAGIWTFGQGVNMLMKHGIVNAEWRKQAAPKSNEINSIAYFTNIGKALEEVTFDRKNMSADYKTNIILLTDGVVDISKDIAESQKERKRILTELVPALKNAGYVIHTIALSDDADADLLKKISVTTDGVFVTAKSADELTNTFLKIFDQAVPADRVPLENNNFLVDSSIKEFTALIFRKPGVDKTIFASPDGKEYSETDPKDGVNWYRTDRYDLITATNPKVGQWKIKTEITSQSRVTVVSNLQLFVQPLKNNIHINDKLLVNYSFQENGTTITNKDFLGLIEANAIIAKEGTAENATLDLTMPVPMDGIYHQKISLFKEAGSYEIHLYVDGKTFKREFKHSLHVIDSVLSVNKNNVAGEDGKVARSYKISIDEKLVDPRRTRVTATIKDSLDNSNEQELTIVNANHWELSFTPEETAEYKIIIRAQGEMLDSSPLDETLTADSFTYIKKQKAKEDPVKVEEPPAPVAEVHAEKAPEKSKSNLLMYIGIGLGNLLVVVLGYFGYRAYKRSKNELSEIEKTLAQQVKPPAKKAEEKVAPQANAEGASSEDSIVSDLMSPSAFPLDKMEDSKDNT